MRERERFAVEFYGWLWACGAFVVFATAPSWRLPIFASRLEFFDILRVDFLWPVNSIRRIVGTCLLMQGQLHPSAYYESNQKWRA